MFVRVTWLTVGWLHLLQSGPSFSLNTVSMCLHHTHTQCYADTQKEKNPLWFSHQAELQKTHKTDAANVSTLMHMETLHVCVICNCVLVSENINVWVNVCCVSVCQWTASVQSTLAFSDHVGLSKGSHGASGLSLPLSLVFQTCYHICLPLWIILWLKLLRLSNMTVI